MILNNTFEPAASGLGSRQASPDSPARRPAPFSVRLSTAERDRLVAEAGGAPLGAYIKAKALGGAPIRSRRSGLAVEDRAALAQALALLGRSNLSNNLNQLAKLAHIGALPFTPDTEAELLEAVRALRALRILLLRALGLKPEDGP